MSAVARTTVSPDVNTLTHIPNVTGLYAGETLAAGAVVYVKAADGKVYNCTGAAANAAAGPWGFVFRQANAGEPVTIWGKGARFTYDSGGSLTPGTIYYISGSVAGALDTATSTGDAVGVVRAISTTEVQICRDF